MGVKLGLVLFNAEIAEAKGEIAERIIDFLKKL
jgi:hypothetical protein